MALQLSKLLNNPLAQPFTNLSNFMNFVDLSSTAANLFVVSPDGERESYIFDTRGEEEVNLESEITDKWVEDNTTMQDHIGLKPETITLRGYVGELTNKSDPTVGGVYKGISKKLDGISAFAPKLTSQTQYILNRAEETYGIYKNANKSIERIEEKMAGIPIANITTHQYDVFAKLMVLWKKRSLSTIYTPFGKVKNMAILSINARQDEETSYISEFSVTFKRIRIAGLITTYNNASKEKEANARMTMSNQLDKGINKPGDDKTTLAAGLDAAVSGVKGAVKKILSGK